MWLASDSTHVRTLDVPVRRGLAVLRGEAPRERGPRAAVHVVMKK